MHRITNSNADIFLYWGVFVFKRIKAQIPHVQDGVQSWNWSQKTFFRNTTTCFCFEIAILWLGDLQWAWVFTGIFTEKSLKPGWKFESGVFSIPPRFLAFPTPIRSIFGVFLSYKTAGARCLAMDGCLCHFFGRCFPTSKRVKADFDGMVGERIPKAIQWLMGASLGFVFFMAKRCLK